MKRMAGAVSLAVIAVAMPACRRANDGTLDTASSASSASTAPSALSALYSIQYMEHYPDYGLYRYYPYFLLFVAGMYGIVIVTDLMGRTTIDNLYALGEVAMTGVHGANRLGGNALLDRRDAQCRDAQLGLRQGRDRSTRPARLGRSHTRMENAQPGRRGRSGRASGERSPLLRNTSGLPRPPSCRTRAHSRSPRR